MHRRELISRAARRCALGVVAPAIGLETLAQASAAQPFSAAERALFLADHLAGLRPPMTLHYHFGKSGSLEPEFEDTVEVMLSAQADGTCCAAAARFLSGARQLELPHLESAKGNPVILFFLERDVREMQRLTKGQPIHFRKRIRLAVAEGASMRRVSVPWNGRQVVADEISIAPYADDPQRLRFERLADKRYVFTLSGAVPGRVVSIRTTVAGPGTTPLIVEEIRAVPAAAPRSKS